MMTQIAPKSPEYRDEQQKILFRRRIRTKCGLFFCVVFVFTCSVTWYSYHLCKQIVYEEIQQRGVWVARNIVDKIWEALLHKDYPGIEKTITSLDLEEDIHYIVVLDAANTRIFSQHDEKRAFSWPEVFRPFVCDRLEPEISRYAVGDERFFHIALRIAQPPGILHERSVETAVSLTQQSALPEKSECLGMLHLGLSLHTADEKLGDLRISSMLLIGGTLLLSCIGFALLSRRVVTPLRRLSALMSNIAAGDIRQTIRITSTTEIRWLEVGLSNILSSFQKFATNLNKAKEQAAVTSEEILNISEEHADVHQKQMMLMHQMSQNLEEATASSIQMANLVTGLAEEADSGLQTTQNARKTIGEAISSIEEIRAQVEKNTERVVLLGEKIAQIDNVVKIITTIADQTKLIAFNASIEAAGAGEAGGRFSVVATEVRRLANTVVESVEEIKHSVSSIQTSTSELTLSSETGIRKVNQGTGLVAEIGQTVQHIMTLLDTMAQTARTISDALQQQQFQTSSMAESVKDAANTAEQALEMTKRSREIARDLHDFAGKRATIL